MKNLGCFKDFKVRPLDGQFDARTPSGELNFYDFRVVLNMDLTEQRKRCRMGGWQKLLSDSPFGFLNQDLHDQLVGCQSYYESISYSVTYALTLTGYAYPIWYGEQDVPGELVTEPEEGTYYGYAPDYYPIYPPAPSQGHFICESYIGAPYGEGDSYFGLCYGAIEGAYTVPPYGAGDPFPTYLGPYQYDAEYCGNYAYLRDQQCREAITFLFEAVSVGGRRRLLAGTKSRVYVLNERSGNWRILLDGQGGDFQDDNCVCSQRRFKAAQVGNVVLLTNNFDPVMTWVIDAGATGCELWSAEYITDLLGFGITKAGVVASWRGFALVADVELQNERHGSRIYWSDLNAPREWVPGGNSLAGFVDLGLGERVVAIAPIGGQLRVYTVRGDEKAIYDVSIVGGDEILNFQEIYRGPDGLEYENSLVNTGDTHLWLSTSGVMVLGEYDRSPQRIEWIYKADGVFYNGLPGEWLRDFDGLSGFGPVNMDRCANVVGGFNSERKQVWFSWPTDENECANMSLVLNPVYRVATLVDHGFSAFLTYRPDFAITLRDFLAQYAGCDPALLISVKEGEPLDVETGYLPAYIRNEGEDPDAPAVANSVCGYLGGMSLEDLCDLCGVESKFVMASTADKTLKEFTPHQYYRERYVGPEATEPECALTITTQPAGSDLTAGDTLTLTVAANGNVGTITYQWYRNGVALTNGAAGGATISGATSATLTIESITEALAGNYTVVVSDSVIYDCSVTSASAAVAVAPEPSPAGTNTISFAFFMSPTAEPDEADADILSNYAFELWDAPAGSVQGAIRLSCTADGGGSGNYKFTVTVEQGGDSNTVTTASISMPVRTWHHVAVVYDGSTGYAKLYVDATLVGTTSGTSVVLTSQPYGYVYMQCAAHDVLDYLDSYVFAQDLTGYWIGHALTAAELTALYNSGAGLNGPPWGSVTAPTAWWNFDDAGRLDGSEAFVDTIAAMDLTPDSSTGQIEGLSNWSIIKTGFNRVLDTDVLAAFAYDSTPP